MTSVEHGARKTPAVGKGVAVIRALAAAVIMALCLVVSTEASAALLGVDATAASGFGARVVVASCVTAIVVGLILLLRRRLDGRALSGIGLTGLRTDATGFALGLGVLLASGLAVLLTLDLTGVNKLPSFAGYASVAIIVFSRMRLRRKARTQAAHPHDR